MTDTTVVVALVVSLVALLIALLQVLQQYTGTADGFRRCQRPVMGEWALLTHRKFRWGEFRFETTFGVPVLFLYDPARIKREVCPLKGRPVINIDGTCESYRSTFLSQFMEGDHPQPRLPTPNEKSSAGNEVEDENEDESFREQLSRAPKNALDKFKRNRRLKSKFEEWKKDNELVSWIHLLETLQWHQRVFSQHIIPGFQPDIVTAIQISRRSWDFVPPDVIKPYAVANIGDIAIIAQRLGMSWKDFRPGEGVMRAEGNNCLITSTVVRSLGIVLSFSADSHLIDYEERHRNVYVPSWQASLLGFGLVPRSDIAPEIPIGRTPHNAFPVGKEKLFDCYLRSFCGYPQDEQAFGRIDESRHLSGTYGRLLLTWSDLDHSVASEFVALVAPVLRMRNSTISRVFRPASNIGNEVLSSQFSMQSFCRRLQTLVLGSVGTSQQLQLILTQCNEILSHRRWDKANGHPMDYDFNQSELELLDLIHDAWDATTEVLKNPWFESLLRSHLRELLAIRDGHTQTSRQEIDASGVSSNVSPEEDIMGHYFEVCRPRIIEQVQQKHALGKEDTVTLNSHWVTMIFRSLCWYSLHRFKFKHAIVDFQYFESKQQVYIG